MSPELMSSQLFVLLSSLVEDAAGTAYGSGDHQLFASKVKDHASEAGYDSLLDYYYYLRYDDRDGVELRRLVESLLVHESYFFRELSALEALIDHYLVDVLRQRGTARVWSSACATGEEPYTLAMLLEERGLLDRVQIVATDLSTSALARAASGRHSRRALRDGHPAQLAAKYLEVSPQGVIVAPRIRSAVRFERVNLIDNGAIARLGIFDAILCRNVFIYFRDARVQAVVERLSASLVADGLLVVGVSESLLRLGTRLVCEERGGSFFYRKASA